MRALVLLIPLFLLPSWVSAQETAGPGGWSTPALKELLGLGPNARSQWPELATLVDDAHALAEGDEPISEARLVVRRYGGTISRAEARKGGW